MTYAVDTALARSLVAEQFPQWSGLEVRPVAESGNDHRTFRVGDRLLARFPSGPGYAPQVGAEQRWLPVLAPLLPLPIPEVRGTGTATDRFPAAWSVYGWIDGARPTAAIRDDIRFAADLAEFLTSLRRIDASDGPAPGARNGHRGAPLAVYDDEMRDIVERVDGAERDLARGLWRDALDAPFAGPPVWVHGDVAIANLLARDGVLAAVIDWGCFAVGDPACDAVILWTQFRGAAREAFRRASDLDEATWARGRGWALWKALLMLDHEPAEQRAFGRRVLDELLGEV